MDIRECIEFIRDTEKELRLFNVGRTESLRADLEAYFETQNGRITGSRTASGAPADVAVRTDETADTWFVVFDGGGDDAQKSF